MKPTIVCCLLLWPMIACSQYLLSFDDPGNPSRFPEGDTNFIVRDGKLQSACLLPNTRFYCSFASPVTGSAYWELSFQLKFNPSGANYVDWYINATDTVLPSSTTAAYFVRMGGTKDECSFYRQFPGAEPELLIDGRDGRFNKSDNTGKLRLLLDDEHRWYLFHDSTGTGEYFQLEGSMEDTAYLPGGYIGIAIRQSTPSFFGQHFFDDIRIMPAGMIGSGPILKGLSPLNDSAWILVFDAPVLLKDVSLVAGSLPGYDLLPDPVAANRLILSFREQLPPNIEFPLTLYGIRDYFGNKSGPVEFNIAVSKAGPADILISEIMYQPLPAMPYPVRYIELKNSAQYPVNLAGWQLISSKGSLLLPSVRMGVGSYLLICDIAAREFFPGKDICTVNTMLNLQSKDQLILLDNSGQWIHAVSYQMSLYQDPVKALGGWSLELTDDKLACYGGTGWAFSLNGSGGTPGMPNSQFHDTVANANDIRSIYCPDEYHTELCLEVSYDLQSAQLLSRYSLDNVIHPKAITLDPFKNMLLLEWERPLDSGNLHRLSIEGIKTCDSEDEIRIKDIRFGWAQPPAEGMLLINEILFNPHPGQQDYLEIYNKSDKVLNLQQLFIANRNGDGSLGTIVQASGEPDVILPGEYIVFCKDPRSLCSQYICKNEFACRTVASLPSFPDKQGCALLLDYKGTVLDEFCYGESMHSPAISNVEGIALERVSWNLGNVHGNWQSAASSAGYGTPGYENSRYLLEGSSSWKVNPKIISPNNDGWNDICSLTIPIDLAGNVLNVYIFDILGNLVNHWVKNVLLAGNDVFIWDGKDDQDKLLPAGQYLFLLENYDIKGHVGRKKIVVAIVRNE